MTAALQKPRHSCAACSAGVSGKAISAVYALLTQCARHEVTSVISRLSDVTGCSSNTATAGPAKYTSCNQRQHKPMKCIFCLDKQLPKPCVVARNLASQSEAQIPAPCFSAMTRSCNRQCWPHAAFCDYRATRQIVGNSRRLTGSGISSTVTSASSSTSAS